MRKLLVVLLVVTGFSAFGQQLPQYTQWYWNQFALNPAHAGIRDCFELKAQYRFQYTGIEGMPHYGNFTLTTPINRPRKEFLTPRHGIGLKMATEKIGIFLTNRINLSYAAHLNFSQDNRLSVGIDAGVKQLAADIGSITTENFDPTVHQYVSNWMPDANIGFWWNSKNYYVGLVLKEFLGSKWKNIGLESRYTMHTFLNGGYRFVGKNGFSFFPSMLLKMPVKGKTSADIVLLFDHNNQFSYAISYRTSEAVMFAFNVKIKEMFAIGYSFDYVFRPLGGFPNSSHEISLTLSGCKAYKKTQTGCDLF